MGIRKHSQSGTWGLYLNWLLLIDSPFEVSRTRKFGLRLVNFADGQPSLSPRMCVKSINHLKNINICNDKKPIRSRDKDACDTSAQRGMCCCCDGVKCSNVDVVLVSTIWDLSSVRIFDIAPNYAWPDQGRGWDFVKIFSISERLTQQ